MSRRNGHHKGPRRRRTKQQAKPGNRQAEVQFIALNIKDWAADEHYLANQIWKLGKKIGRDIRKRPPKDVALRPCTNANRHQVSPGTCLACFDPQKIDRVLIFHREEDWELPSRLLQEQGPLQTIETSHHR